jgi:hypothetical protein
MIDGKMEQETQGKTNIDNINQDKEQIQSIELESPKAGTATSSPDDLTPSPSILASSPTIINVILWMKKQAYEETTIKATVNDSNTASCLTNSISQRYLCDSYIVKSCIRVVRFTKPSELHPS